jgi:hypothetical protein
MGFFSALRKLRRARVLRDCPLADELWNRTVARLPILSCLSAPELFKLREISTVFLSEKRFQPLRGASIDDDLRVAVAAQACLPILELGLDWYSEWKTILVIPDAYEITRSEIDDSGVVHEYRDELAGEVLHLGPVVLSVVDVLASGSGDGYNVVIHEAAHKLDGKDYSFDGCPPLPQDIPIEEWRSVFTDAYELLRAGHRRKRRRSRPRIDPYASFSPDEFFAVSVESFFECPAVLRSDFPGVYALLCRFFRQDPYGRLTA